MKQKIGQILHYLRESRGYDFSGNRINMLQRRISTRQYATKTSDFDEYYEYLTQNHDEIDNLLDAFTINVTSFFRDTLSFAYLEKHVLSNILASCIENKSTLRVWSAGCASGEEAYSVAILLKELFDKEKTGISASIFATDIDRNVIEKAKLAIYNEDAMKDVPLKYLNKYFEQNNGEFHLKEQIKEMVNFSVYDLLSSKYSVPPESVFGDFDLVLCRNVLIYFESDFQKIILDKLLKSLKLGGYLMLGESEIPTTGELKYFVQINANCKIFKKIF
ncbi:MAG: protein-glutamate O-methyltransferase CheR [Candidatus Cloacimonetes bacterium]|nr:protein-glutamate O-methyltransferase CheR [Candidatus Cloacimonadota bacterium]MCF7814388.1 protein-glutamate O-methyltransferase CheR [Candidatus Cloacimonadota bacterium]MCF7868532.1 protein-glutamate O-methyltransferase CheR [Candidatus Cloacimonadota bacterium]MCF7884048.1 protein-glutamate O-methyltransferase CheR [Candidatus Cloacimonadota bacterium]